MNYDLFVDESCHLEHDTASVMCIGYIKVPRVAYHELKKRLIDIKHKHNMHKELKWSKFSKAKIALYIELADFFFKYPLKITES